ncbi:MAG: DnaJ domain-containing protein [Planctomycetes bacterium]|nr:DnaJ domain-containing protein [Planctomycetota bacterium]
MGLKYKDYYDILGVPRGASQEEIRRAYRDLARKYHPDLNKAADAERRFKEVNEAHEVLGDPEKRKRYDALGANWQAGQEFQPPPGFGEGGFDFGGGSFGEFRFGEGLGGFSDFFEALFGRAFGPGNGRGARGRGAPSGERTMRGEDVEAELELDLGEAIAGGTRSLHMRTPSGERTYEVRIPALVPEGGRIRLAGQGQPGLGGGPAGDLMLVVRYATDPRFTRLEQGDLEVRVPVAPWEVLFGGPVTVPTPGGEVVLRVPADSQGGQKLRLRGQGMPRKGGGRGDLYAVLEIRVPQQLTPRERELFAALARESQFKPRG